MRALLAGARRKQPALLDLTQQLVPAESPSDVKAAVDALRRAGCGSGQGVGRAREAASATRIWRCAGSSLRSQSRETGAAGRVLLLGHLDTVWPLGTLKTMPCKLSDGRLCGPGAFDMKAGVAMALTALEMLSEADLLGKEIVLLLNSDEEVGSPVSRPITEKLAGECGGGVCAGTGAGTGLQDGTQRDGQLENRCGRGGRRMPGVDFEKGANALVELARAVQTVSGWTDLKRGLTVSVGVAGGGTKLNVVPAEAWAEVDVRFARKADGPRIERKFAGLKAVDKRCTLAVTGGINRPPMERSRGTVRLYEKARALAAELGFVLEEAATGGASDGNFTAALGVPTLDGLGAVGEGAHARHESVVVEHLAPRTALLAGLLAG